MSDALKQIQESLDKKIPGSVVETRDGGGGRQLSYLSGFYVTKRLNEVFGSLGWSKEVLEIKEIENKVSRGGKEMIFPAYLAKVRLTILAAQPIIKEAYGYGSDKSGLNAHELAIKEAVTDATKVAAKDLGMSLGLALYDKEQEYVDHESEETKSSPPVAKASKPRSQGSSVERAPSSAQAPQGAAAGSASPESTIRDMVGIAIAKKRLGSKDEFRDYLTTKYSVKLLAELTEDQKVEVIQYLKGVIS